MIIRFSQPGMTMVEIPYAKKAPPMKNRFESHMYSMQLSLDVHRHVGVDVLQLIGADPRLLMFFFFTPSA